MLDPGSCLKQLHEWPEHPPASRARATSEEWETAWTHGASYRNLTIVNAYQERIDGDDRLLPYFGQLTLLEQGDNEIWLVDSEDFVFCFNLVCLPPCLHRYMAFEKQVDARVFGGALGTMVTLQWQSPPMGWISSVAVIQSIVRSLVFDSSSIPLSSE